MVDVEAVMDQMDTSTTSPVACSHKGYNGRVLATRQRYTVPCPYYAKKRKWIVAVEVKDVGLRVI
ncbi:MAG: hypothetical protein M3Y72_18840 [Acidobacteriota bacterium]|nr:hypothetical protein [Acidobacteriota bacterium]